MSIIDFHSHILPAMDDGSSSVEKSIHMYHMSAAQGTEIIAATPHFYASRDWVEDFLCRRERAYHSLCVGLENPKSTPSPHIHLGAEVSYFPGISQAKKLSQLTFEGTRLLLLEPPFEEWNETVIREIEILMEERGFEVMLAHLERYLQISGNKKRIDQILELPVHVQINAGSLLDWRRRRKALKLFRKSQSHVLGSDMHGTTRRPPNLMEGRAVLEKSFGAVFLKEMDASAKRLLNS